MGNRAVIALESMPEVGIYVHWNGGLESVLAFLEATKQRGARSPGADGPYAFGRLAQTTADFFHRSDGELISFGVGPLDRIDCDNHDNGLYWIGNDWTISRREYSREASATKLPDLDLEEREKYEGILKSILEVDEAREGVLKRAREDA